MSALNNLKFVVSKRSNNISPIIIKRQKLSLKIQEQISHCQAIIDGNNYEVKRTKTYIDELTGERIEKQITKRVREWYWVNEQGKINLAIRYGAKTLVLAKGGKNAIEVNNKQDVIDTLKIINNAVIAGELDDAINEAGANLRTNLKK